MSPVRAKFGEGLTEGGGVKSRTLRENGVPRDVTESEDENKGEKP